MPVRRVMSLRLSSPLSLLSRAPISSLSLRFLNFAKVEVVA